MKIALTASLFFLLGGSLSAQEHANARTVYAKGINSGSGTSVKDTSSERKSDAQKPKPFIESPSFKKNSRNNKPESETSPLNAVPSSIESSPVKTEKK